MDSTILQNPADPDATYRFKSGKHHRGYVANLVTTNFQGKKPEDIFADFEFSPDGKKVLKCAGGQVPATNSYNAKTEQCRITLDREICDSCPYKDQCRPKFHKTKTSKVLSWKTLSRAKQLRYMKTSEFVELAKIRNGIESLPSILRRKYRVDEMPVRGRLRTKLFFGFKVAALNFKKLLDYLSSLDNCALKPEFC